MKILVTDQSGVEHELARLDGWRTMEVIRDWGLNSTAECGGGRSRGTWRLIASLRLPIADCRLPERSQMKILVTDQSGVEHELEGLDGWRTMEVIRDWGLNIKAECGGACSCATCHVYVEDGWFEKLPDPSDDEEDLLYSCLLYTSRCV